MMIAESRIGKVVEYTITGILFVVLIYFTFATTEWQLKHPKANRMTIIQNLPDALTLGENEALK